MLKKFLPVNVNVDPKLPHLALRNIVYYVEKLVLWKRIPKNPAGRGQPFSVALLNVENTNHSNNRF